MSLPSHKVESLLKQKFFGAKALAHIKANTDKLLITILVGNNLVNVYTAALATQISIALAKTSGIEESLAIGMATWLITFLILVFGEIVPKSFAAKNAEFISLKVAPIYKFLMVILAPIIFFLEILIKVFIGKTVPTRVTDKEIESFIDLWKDSGALEDDEHEMLKNTLEFGDTLIEEIMVPRVKIDALSDMNTVDEALEYYLSHTHSRIPVFHKQIDNIVWILTIRDILRERRAGHNDKKLKELHFKKFLKAPINQPIDTLLENFKSSRQHIAVIMDEYGWVAWITTIEDVVEEVFWEIHDETDFETAEIIKNEDGSFTIYPSILLDAIVDEFKLELWDLGMNAKEFGSETVSYMITHRLERFPKQDEEISFKIYDENGKAIKQKLCFKVIEINDSTIGKVEVRRK
jgi:putative hemolysin